MLFVRNCCSFIPDLAPLHGVRPGASATVTESNLLTEFEHMAVDVVASIVGMGRVRQGRTDQ
jgi:hypothetical protein